METSHVVAAILMLVSPAVFALGYQLYQPEHAVGRDGSATRRLHIWLWSLTTACVGLWAGLAAGRPDPWLAGWSGVPSGLLSGGRVEQIVWLLTFPLWFGVVMRFLVLSRPEPLPATPTGSVHRRAEPADALDSRELSDLYAVHRVSKVWGLYWILLGLVTLLSSAAVCGVWATSTAATLGVVVGVGGSAVGTGGAVFGIYMANQRGRITGVLDRTAES